MTTGRFERKVALITGAGRGLGREYALLLAARGARVVVNDLGGDTGGTGQSADPAADVVAEIARAGGDAIADPSDVVTGADTLVKTAVDTWGRLDLVINNAGVSGGGSIDSIPPGAYDRMIDVHYRGTVAVLRAAWPVLRNGGYGRIVNTSSGSVIGVPWSSAYVSAKSAIIGLTRALALDGRRSGIMVNAVMPVAWTRLTKQVPDPAFRSFLSAQFDPSKVAPFVASLLTDEVPCSGETFSVGGGIASRLIFGMTPGYVAKDPDIDDYLRHFDRICDPAGMFVPIDSMAEMAYRAAQLGLRLDDPTLGTAEPIP